MLGLEERAADEPLALVQIYGLPLAQQGAQGHESETPLLQLWHHRLKRPTCGGIGRLGVVHHDDRAKVDEPLNEPSLNLLRRSDVEAIKRPDRAQHRPVATGLGPIHHWRVEPAATGAEPLERRGLPRTGQIARDRHGCVVQLLQESLPSKRERPFFTLHVVAQLVTLSDGPGCHTWVVLNPLADREEGRRYGQIVKEIKQRHCPEPGLIGTGTGEVINGEGQQRSFAWSFEDDLHSDGLRNELTQSRF